MLFKDDGLVTRFGSINNLEDTLGYTLEYILGYTLVYTIGYP